MLAVGMKVLDEVQGFKNVSSYFFARLAKLVLLIRIGSQYFQNDSSTLG